MINSQWRPVSFYKNKLDLLGLPNDCGVYVIGVISFNFEMLKPLYVGRTSNFKKRFSCHRTLHKINKYQELEECEYIGIKIKSTKKHKKLEIKLIQRLKPKYNKFFNWG